MKRTGILKFGGLRGEGEIAEVPWLAVHKEAPKGRGTFLLNGLGHLEDQGIGLDHQGVYFFLGLGARHRIEREG